MPRVKIIQIFEDSESRHLSAEDIFKKLIESGEDVGLATVYRVLTQFEAAGLLTRHHFEGERAFYEINEGKHHDHLVCVTCGKIEEFLDESIEARQRIIAKRYGFQITDHCMYLYGICRDCGQRY